MPQTAIYGHAIGLHQRQRRGSAEEARRRRQKVVPQNARQRP